MLSVKKILRVKTAELQLTEIVVISYIYNTCFSPLTFKAAVLKFSIDLYSGEKLMGHPAAASCITFALLYKAKNNIPAQA
jgi:hypothetical protein